MHVICMFCFKDIIKRDRVILANLECGEFLVGGIEGLLDRNFLSLTRLFNFNLKPFCLLP